MFWKNGTIPSGAQWCIDYRHLSTHCQAALRPHHRFPGSCFIMCIIWFSPFGNEKVLVPRREQGQKIQFLRYHLVCRKSDRSVRRQHAVCPLTLAMRQKILWSPISLCPRRPICCPAFRSALSYAELSVDAPCSFTSASLVSIYVMPFIHHLCTFVKNFFSCGADFFLNTPVPRP